jgi:hypothetical protein
MFATSTSSPARVGGQGLGSFIPEDRMVVSFRPDQQLFAFLSARRQKGESLGREAERLLCWLAVLLDEGYEELRRAGFAQEEINAVLQALREAAFAPEEPPLLWVYVAEALGDEHPLTRKVRGLSPAARFALADLAWRVWRVGNPEAKKEAVPSAQA